MDNIPLQASEKKGENLAISGFIIGIIGFIPCLLPICGGPISIVGLVLSILGRKSSKTGLALTGIILNSLWLLLTIVNAAVGAYMGATGQHELVNRILGHH